MSITKSCQNCAQSFEITDFDLAFYDKISPVFGNKKFPILPPSLCPDCRQQRRLSWRNERKLYKRNCNKTEKPVVSIYSPESPHVIYAADFWWSDGWSPMEYGQEFDFSKNFAHQFSELLLKIPRPAIINRNSVNSEYTNICEDNKNCYLVIESSTNEDCLYSYWIQKSQNCIDCSYCSQSELCYECDNCQNCYRLFFSQNCQNCRDSGFLKNCIACKNCFGCVNLKQKEFCLNNEQFRPTEYFKKIKKIFTCSSVDFQNVIKSFTEFKLQQINKYAEICSSEECYGDYISHSRSCYQCYSASDSWDCRYAYNIWRNSKDNIDVDTAGMNSELNYECINTAINSSRNLGCARCWGVHNSYYCNECDYSKNLFGCIGLRNKKYCIFNKQYGKDEYEIEAAKIIEKMQADGEWGQFFPILLSPFAYNETVAQEYFPLTKEDALKKGYKWHDADPKSYQPQTFKILYGIKEVPDSIVNEILVCQNCHKNYKIIPQELKFYRQMNLPIPDNCPDCRHQARLKLRNPRHLWNRSCANCQKAIQTSYAPERPEIVYCEECYLKAVY